MTLFPFIVLGLIAAACGMAGALIGRAAHAELRSQVEQLRRSIAVLELQSPRPATGRRELQLIARISTVLP